MDIEYKKNNPLRCFFAFEGYNSQGLALNRLKQNYPDFDWVCVGRSEIDKYAIQAADALFPEAKDKNHGDISKIDWNEVPDFDLFTMSSPCFVAGTLVLTRNGYKPKEEIEKREGTLCEFYPEFVGFVGIYYYLSKVIPKDYTIIDFGAAHNAQSYFFTEHKKYIVVNPFIGIKEDDGLFLPHKCYIYRMTTGEFLNTVDYQKEKVFAI